jgi:single-stranded-DNA-specific exonuclease
MAAGLSLDATNLPIFRRNMVREVEKALGAAQLQEAVLQIDNWLELPDISLELVLQIESLAPFGPGNEELVMATRNLALKSVTEVGRNAEHLRVTVVDQAANLLTTMWWGGAGEGLPEGIFDLAYTLRASNFRGKQQVAAEFVGWRAGAAMVVEVRETRKILDWRDETDKVGKLRSFMAKGSSKTVIWAEGTHKTEIGGLARHELTEAETLVIWTAPPSQRVLQAAIDRVQPKVVVLAAANPDQAAAKVFIERLTGLVKFAMEHKGGRASLDSLAAATVQDEATIRLGVEWLEKRGKISYRIGLDGEIRFTPAESEGDKQASDRIRALIQQALDETAAYRAYFMRAQKPVE